MNRPAQVTSLDSSKSQSSVQMSMQSYHSSTTQKYGGLIKPPYYRVLRGDMIQLATYAFSEVPTTQIMQDVVSAFRILQLVGPALFAPFSTLWTKDTSGQRTVSTISVLFNLILPAYRQTSGQIFLYVYLAMMFVYISIFLASVHYYKVNSNLPIWLTSFLVYFYSIPGFILPPISLEIAFEDLGRIIFQGARTDLGAHLFVIIAVTFLSTALIYINVGIVAQSLTFRIASLMSVITMPSNLVNVATFVVSVLLGFASQAPRSWQVPIVFITTFFYIGCAFVPFYYGGFVQFYISAFVFSTSASAGISCLTVGSLLLRYKTAGITEILAFFAVNIITFLFANFVFRRFNVRNLMLLDEIMSDIDAFDKIKRETTFLNAAIAGFRISHPVCANWNLFRLGVEKFRRSGDVWLLFAKFVAIYPEEMQTLSWIYKSVIESKLKGQSARCIKQQTIVLVRSRETNLCADLKDKLAMIQRNIHTTMHKLSRVWDVSIQGNISEVETSTKSFVDERSRNEAAFQRLFRQFPNNRFVYRAYGHFLTDISADRETAAEMFEKMRLLQTGHSINRDNSHELGCRAFPMVPERLTTGREAIVEVQSDLSQSTMTDEQSDETNVQKNDNSMYRDMIDKMKIPAVSESIAERGLLFIIFVLGVYLGLIFYVESYITNLTEPLEYLIEISQLRTLNSQAATFSNRLIYENLGNYSVSGAVQGVSLNTFDGSWNISNELEIILINISQYLQSLEGLHSYKTSESLVDNVRSILFNENFEFKYFTSATNETDSLVSIPSAMTDYVIQISKVINSSISENETNGPVVLNPLANSYNLSIGISNALDYMNEYVNIVHTRTLNISKIVLFCIMAMHFLVYGLIELRQFLILSRTKVEVYRCLTVLPKNQVSLLSENLRIFKKKNSESSSSNTTDQEMSKREESIIKLFNSGASNTSKVSDLGILAAGSLIISCLNCFGTYLLYSVINSISEVMSESVPQIEQVSGAYSAETLAVLFLSSLSLISSSPSIWTDFNIGTQFLTSMNTSNDYWKQLDMDLTSLNTYVKARYSCDNNYSTAAEMYRCYDADEVFESLGMFMDEAYIGGNLIPSSDVLKDSFEVLRFPLFDSFFSSYFWSAESEITTNLMSLFNASIPKIIGLMFASAFVEAIIVIGIMIIDHHIRDVLRIILHCSPLVIRQSSKIMEVLGGEFKPPRADFTSKSKDYFDSVYNSLIDAVLYTDSAMNIISCNDACSRIFGQNPDQLINQNLTSFLQSDSFSGNVGALIGPTSATNEKIVYRKGDGSEVALLVSATSFDHKVILTAADVTSMVRYQKLIEEEKGRSDRLLASIIPASLVSRVQAGEKQISFSVQSASIIFCDVVEFTPWCGSVPASKVMRTLNSLFGRLDALLVKYPTITRIKGIGDCYMAAGGIFSEINQPAEHAKEAVAFGLDVIDTLTSLNADLGENLRIRVGINTGGPIVAGVLGISKPTFEIFGPAINMAQQMEHNGVPMQVHISRSVYELVYGESFKIKERGTIEVKGGKVLTYLVMRPEAK